MVTASRIGSTTANTSSAPPTIMAMRLATASASSAPRLLSTQIGTVVVAEVIADVVGVVMGEVLTLLLSRRHSVKESVPAIVAYIALLMLDGVRDEDALEVDDDTEEDSPCCVKRGVEVRWLVLLFPLGPRSRHVLSSSDSLPTIYPIDVMFPSANSSFWEWVAFDDACCWDDDDDDEDVMAAAHRSSAVAVR